MCKKVPSWALVTEACLGILAHALTGCGLSQVTSPPGLWLSLLGYEDRNGAYVKNQYL